MVTARKESIKEVAWPLSGRYVVAVSGGVDSMALLDLLVGQATNQGYQLEVAHFHHGWSESSDRYVEVVQAACDRYGLKLHAGREKVAQNEAAAREARYRFLRRVMEEIRAAGIITAHHRDDLIETVVLNLLRGTGRRGLSPFAGSLDVVRPLVQVRKSDLVQYARERGLSWVEDPTNSDTKFRRNAVRHELLPQLRLANPDFEAEFLAIIDEAAELNHAIDTELRRVIKARGGEAQVDAELARRSPLATLTELLVMMARLAQPGAELDRRTVEALAVDLKTSRLREPRQLSRSLFASRARATVTITFNPYRSHISVTLGQKKRGRKG
jgi:tRNA(Ile)-lysidine synthase